MFLSAYLDKKNGIFVDYIKIIAPIRNVSLEIRFLMLSCILLVKQAL